MQTNPTSPDADARDGAARDLKSWDVLRALQVISEGWPTVIHPRHGLGDECPGRPRCRRFSKRTARAVLMTLYELYNWKTFQVCIPMAHRRARPANDKDIAGMVAINRRTAG